MFFSDRSTRLPNLSAYLEFIRKESRVAMPLPEWIKLGYFAAAAAFVIGVGTHHALVATIGALAGAALLFPALKSLAHAKRNARWVRKKAIQTAAEPYFESMHRRKLHKELDAAAAQLLEACAHYWSRSRAELAGGVWVGAYGPLEAQMRAAVDDAMGEALIQCSICIGQPQSNRKDELRSVFDDLASLDIEDALGGLRTIAKADSSKYAHQSPHMSAAFEPVRQIADKLRESCEEIERTASELRLQGPVPTPTQAAHALETVLSELRAVRQADIELDEQQVRHLQG